MKNAKPPSPNQNPTPSFSKPPRFRFLFVIAAIWLVLILHDFLQYQRNYEQISYSDFLQAVESGQVKEVAIGSTQIQGLWTNPQEGKPKSFIAQKVEDPKLVDALKSSNIKFSQLQESTFFRDILSWVIPVLLMAAIWWFFLFRMSPMRQDVMSFGKSKARIFAEKDISVRFQDVAGVEEAKAELSEIVQFLKNPTNYSRLGGRMPKGILLVGPPGTGKTLLAKAVAGEAGVPFFSINGSEFVELFVGMGAARVRDLFAQARAQMPAIIFIDELDAMGRARGLNAIGGGNDEKEQTLNQLLAELDGFDPAQGIILIGATNRPEVLDPALLRSGRFDRQILVDKPDRQGRAKILAVHMQKVKAAPNINADVIASITAGLSGADLANVVNEAALVATRRNAPEVEMADFTAAIERLIAGIERKTRVLGFEERKRVAYHEMGHAVVGLALGKSEAVHKISIIPRGIGALGYTFRRPTEDKYLVSRHELENQMAVLLGGRVSETIFFDDISTGAADDLDKATEIARAMVTRYGMSQNLGAVTYERESSPLLGGGAPWKRAEYSEATSLEIDREIRGYLERAAHSAERILHRYSSLVEEGARLLLEKETLGEEEIHSLWDSHRERPQVAS